ncbi:MAG: glycerol-phosphatase, partial [Frankiaceae bacterium]|nr:glycerol-phosphatase [Frankiaceae bacterium]
MTELGHQLASCAERLADAYDAALLDLDGVVYRGTEAIAHAAASLRAAAAAGMRLTFVTNNASRTPAEVAAVLNAVGVDAAAADVATSAQAAATLLAARLAPGARVLILGTRALRDAVADAGLTPVASAAEQPDAVVQGFSPDTNYSMLAEATLAVRAGALWIATNLDATIPSERGVLPGNGALVAAVSAATGATPVAAGKPQRPLHDEAVRRTNARRPLVVGDRLDTDVDGALAVGVDSLLVLSGVTALLELVRLPAGRRPSYVGADLR